MTEPLSTISDESLLKLQETTLAALLWEAVASGDRARLKTVAEFAHKAKCITTDELVELEVAVR